jgi:hypothetical protein
LPGMAGNNGKAKARSARLHDNEVC